MPRCVRRCCSAGQCDDAPVGMADPGTVAAGIDRLGSEYLGCVLDRARDPRQSAGVLKVFLQRHRDDRLVLEDEDGETF